MCETYNSNITPISVLLKNCVYVHQLHYLLLNSERAKNDKKLVPNNVFICLFKCYRAISDIDV